MTLELSQGATAAATATADKTDIAGIARLENQTGSVSFRQDVHHRGSIGKTPPTIPSIVVCPLAK
jgi:hypothetical protein